VTRVRKLCQGLSFVGPALCMAVLAVLTPRGGAAAAVAGAVPPVLMWTIVALLSVAFALSAWARAGLYCNHQDMSPKCAPPCMHACHACARASGMRVCVQVRLGASRHLQHRRRVARHPRRRARGHPAGRHRRLGVGSVSAHRRRATLWRGHLYRLWLLRAPRGLVTQCACMPRTCHNPRLPQRVATGAHATGCLPQRVATGVANGQCAHGGSRTRVARPDCCSLVQCQHCRRRRGLHALHMHGASAWASCLPHCGPRARAAKVAWVLH
jgi:hypothetical protein